MRRCRKDQKDGKGRQDACITIGPHTRPLSQRDGFPGLRPCAVLIALAIKNRNTFRNNIHYGITTEPEGRVIFFSDADFVP